MNAIKRNKLTIKRRALRARKKITGRDCIRISVFRSIKHIYAQIIDDSQHSTLVSCSTHELFKDSTTEMAAGDKKLKARAVGIELARRAKDKGIERAVFDRGRFMYHGRIKALAEGLREGGITI